MSDGIEVLSQCVKIGNAIPLWLCIVLLFPLVISIIGFICAIIDGDLSAIVIEASITIVFLMISHFCWYDHFNSTNQQYTEYKVTISDSVNFKEFNDKYEILEQDGKIYTIREKTLDK